MSDTLETLQKAGLGPTQLIRYGYSGTLAAFLAAVVDPALAKKWFDALGTVLSPLVALAIGLGIFVFYREIIGEMFLYPLRHLLHTGFGRIRNWGRRWRKRPPLPIGSFTSLLGEQGVPLFYRRWVYRRLRAIGDVLTPAERAQLDVAHSELHILYITAVEGTIAASYQAIAQLDANWVPLAAISATSLLVAFMVDIRQDAHECARLRSQPIQNKLTAFIGELGFQRRTVTEGNTPPLDVIALQAGAAEARVPHDA